MSFRHRGMRLGGIVAGSCLALSAGPMLAQVPDGIEWLLVITIVDDPTYLTQPFYTSTAFRREPNDRRFDPKPCRTDPHHPRFACSTAMTRG